MEKILTIVIPTYNMEQYLDQCLSSLIVADAQMSKLEVLIVNDGSKDRSSEMAHGYESRYPGTFRVIDKENGNYGSCVNRGLKEAKGKYIKILDADDYFLTDSLQEIIEKLSACDTDVVITNVIDVDCDGSEHGRREFPLNKDCSFSPDEICDEMLPRLFMHSITYKTKNLVENGYRQTEGISYTDLEWAYYPMAFSETICYFPEFLYCYRHGRSGQTVEGAQRCKNLWMEEKVINQMLERLSELEATATRGTSAFLSKRLTLYSSRLYFYYLMEYSKILDEANLVKFDNNLKSKAPSICADLDDITCKLYHIGNFKYIRNWHKRQSRKTFKFWLYDVYRSISNLRHSILGR